MSQDDCKKDPKDCCETRSPHEIFDKINEKPVFSQTVWSQSYLVSATLDVAYQLCKMNKKLDLLLDEVCLVNKTLQHIDKRLCGDDQRPQRDDCSTRCRD